MAQFTNQASLTLNGVTINSNVVTGQITQVLRAWKDAVLDIYKPGDILTYVISIQNSGTTDISGLTVSDDLGAYTFGTGSVVPLTYSGDPVLYYINGIAQTPLTPPVAAPLVIKDISVPAGLSSILIYRASVNSFAPLGAGQQIENTVTISGGGLTSSVTASEIVTPGTAAALTVLKTVSPANLVENGPVTYTITIENRGATAVTAGLIVSDDFTPILDAPISVTYNGAPWAEANNYFYDAATGAFTTLTNAVAVPAATYTQGADGEWTVTPGVTVLAISSTI